MSQAPKISVIIPAYNRANTIDYCIASVLNQTLSPLEVIVIDNGSQDDTVKIAKKYQNLDSRVKVFALDKNIGAQAARNLGIKEARGDWIAFLDSDDEWLPDKLEKQVSVLSKVNNDLWTVVYTNCFRYSSKTGEKEFWALPKTEGDNAYKELLSHAGPMLQGMLTSKMAIEKIGYLDESIPSHHEWDTSIRLAKFCRFAHMEEPLFIYHLHDEVTVSKDKIKHILGYQYVINKYETEIKTCAGKEAWENHLRIQLGSCLNFGLWEEADTYIQQLSQSKNFKFRCLKVCRAMRIRPDSLSMLKEIVKPLIKRRQIESI